MGGGNLPYCYLYDDREGVLVPIPERKKQARQAMDLFLQGYSDERIGNIFGLREGTVRSILTSVVNIGKIPYKGNVYNGLHEPIFSEQEFAMLQYNRKIRATKRAYSQTESNLLTGLCVCGVCGCKMRYQKWSNGNHKIYCMSRNSSMSYLPNYDSRCNNTLEWASDIESQVVDEVLKISLKLSKPESHTESKSEMIENAISKEENKLKRYYELYADGNDMVIDLISKQKTRIEELKAELKAVTKTDNPAKQEIFYEQVKSLADVWDKATQPQRNKILKRIISKIVIVNGNIDIYLNQ
jgi:site-specific DNA recombinase